LLVLENNRPPAEFRAFAEPDNTYDSEYRNLAKGRVLLPSPLLAETPEHSILHFEIDGHGVARSPQVPENGARALALKQGLGKDLLDERAASLVRLRKLLRSKPDMASVGGNLDMVVAAANSLSTSDAPAPSARTEQQAENAPANGRMPDKHLQALQQNDAQQVQLPAAKEEAARLNEYNNRLAIVQRAVSKKPGSNMAESPPTPNQVMAGASASNAQAEAGDKSNSPSRQSPQEAAPQNIKQSMPPAMQAARVTTYKPLWLEGELFLVRAVGDGDGRRVQGVWLRKSALAESLLATIRDLLPDATLTPYQPLVFAHDDISRAGREAGREAGRGSSWSPVEVFTAQPRALERAPLALVSLPWQLVPGQQAAPVMPLWSPLHTMLVVAWGGVALAMFATAMLLGGVVALSERRASFVSSVTHELRTPLTTFRLYSEMLADDMVPEGEQRRGYLRTLQTEATRLTHLVENVLAYSRIERGSARARIEETTVAELAGRAVPRLEERAVSAGMKLAVDLPEDVASARLRADLTATEQILFNLVDNACKYAAPPAGTETLHISFHRDARHLQIRVRDHGPGIPPRERRRLFKPFHKSAQEAAASKPGVGLGLSLSRRLARALGGNLVWEPADGPGTSFRLELPLL
jgi:signal transduction histidine kinase